jgi:hypothetical protein
METLTFPWCGITRSSAPERLGAADATTYVQLKLRPARANHQAGIHTPLRKDDRSALSLRQATLVRWALTVGSADLQPASDQLVGEPLRDKGKDLTFSRAQLCARSCLGTSIAARRRPCCLPPRATAKPRPGAERHRRAGRQRYGVARDPTRRSLAATTPRAHVAEISDAAPTNMRAAPAPGTARAERPAAPATVHPLLAAACRIVLDRS